MHWNITPSEVIRYNQCSGYGFLESSGMILSVTLRFLYALVSHLCLTGLPEVAMPSSDTWQECHITLQHTRPSRAIGRSTPRPFMETSTRSTTYQIDRPTPPWQQQCSHCDSVEASHWSRSFESDATVPADYALTTTTTSRYTCGYCAVDKIHQRGNAIKLKCH